MKRHHDPVAADMRVGLEVPAPASTAASNAGSVFSGASSDAPRCAMTSGGAAATNGWGVAGGNRPVYTLADSPIGQYP